MRPAGYNRGIHMSKDKLTEEEKEELLATLKGASLEDDEIRALVVGEDGELNPAIESEEDLIAAAASALEFVEGLEGPAEEVDIIPKGEAVSGFDAILMKLEQLRADISSLQRGVVGVFATQLLTFRGKVVELKSRISEEMVERLKMKFFKNFIEATFVDIVDNEFSQLEKDLVDKIIEQTQERFKDFAQRVRESEMDLRSTIVEQQDIVKSFMKSLEEEAAAQKVVIQEKEQEIERLKATIKKLQAKLDQQMVSSASSEELVRKIDEYKAQMESLKAEVAKKTVELDRVMKELAKAKEEVQEYSMKLGEAMSEIEVLKAEKATISEVSTKSDAEFEALQKQVEVLEKALAEKREESEKLQLQIHELETQLQEAIKEKEIAEKEAASRLSELESIHEKIEEVTSLEQRIYDLEAELEELKKKLEMVQMQSEAYQKATRLMEKERDLALQQRDLAQERTRRYIKVMEGEASTKALILVDEVGSISLKDLAKTLGKPVPLVTKFIRELEKLGVVKLEGDRAISTLKDIEIQEGEVKLD